MLHLLRLSIITLLVSETQSFTFSKTTSSVRTSRLFSEVEEPEVFSEEGYANINYVIEKLGNRLRNGETLSNEERDVFEDAINAIIDESKKYENGWTAPANDGVDDVDYDAPLDRRMAVGDIVNSGEGNNLYIDPVVEDECYLGKHGELEECVDFDPIEGTKQSMRAKPAVLRFSGEDHFDGILKRVEHPMANPELIKVDAFKHAPENLGPNVPLTKKGTPATKALKAKGVKTHQNLGNIQTNTWGTDPFAGFNFEGTDDEESAIKSTQSQDVPGVHRPARSWGSKNYANANCRPQSYDSSKDKTSQQYGQGSDLNRVQHPNGQAEHDDSFDYDDAELGENVPMTKKGTPATKALREQGTRTHQRLGNIQTNTWGTEPFAGYDATLWGSDDEAGCD